MTNTTNIDVQQFSATVGSFTIITMINDIEKTLRKLLSVEIQCLRCWCRKSDNYSSKLGRNVWKSQWCYQHLAIFLNTVCIARNLMQVYVFQWSSEKRKLKLHTMRRNPVSNVERNEMKKLCKETFLLLLSLLVSTDHIAKAGNVNQVLLGRF